MELLLTHSTALEAYRSTGLRALLAKGEVCPDAVPSCLPAPERLSQLRRYLEFYGFCPKVMERSSLAPPTTAKGEKNLAPLPLVASPRIERSSS